MAKNIHKKKTLKNSKIVSRKKMQFKNNLMKNFKKSLNFIN